MTRDPFSRRAVPKSATGDRIFFEQVGTFGLSSYAEFSNAPRKVPPGAALRANVAKNIHEQPFRETQPSRQGGWVPARRDKRPRHVGAIVRATSARPDLARRGDTDYNRWLGPPWSGKEDSMATNHDEILSDWKKNAAAHDDANFTYLHSLKVADDPRQTDATAAALHAQAFQIIDCTRCANCCKTLNILLDADDVDRIAGHVGMTPEAFTAKYLQAVEGDQFQIVVKPCPFLGADDRCTIYDVRPSACGEYPHTDKSGFAHRTYLHAANAKICPAVFWIVERMRKAGR
jgi:Fe-S-cluster containining protein